LPGRGTVAFLKKSSAKNFKKVFTKERKLSLVKTTKALQGFCSKKDHPLPKNTNLNPLFKVFWECRGLFYKKVLCIISPINPNLYYDSWGFCGEGKNRPCNMSFFNRRGLSQNVRKLFLQLPYAFRQLHIRGDFDKVLQLQNFIFYKGRKQMF